MIQHHLSKPFWRRLRIASGYRCIASLIAVCAALGGVASAALADGSGWTDFALIREVFPREYGLDIYAPGIGNPSSCVKSDWVRLPLSAANYSIISEVILDNARNHRSIKLWVNGCDFDGTGLIIAADTSVW